MAFWKFICELEDFYSFKITCILVRQVISLKKNGGVISKIYCLILWSPICTSLILVSASVKMTGTSATVPYSMRGASRLVVGPPPPPFQCYLSLNPWCVCFVYLHHFTISIICVSQEEIIASNEQIYTFYKWVIF